jgi:hypothetical protein
LGSAPPLTSKRRVRRNAAETRGLVLHATERLMLAEGYGHAEVRAFVEGALARMAATVDPGTTPPEGERE